MAPPKRYRLVPSEKMLPSFRVGALEANVGPSLDICPHIEGSALLKGFERSMVEMVLGIETDTLSFVTWPCQHKRTMYQTKPSLGCRTVRNSPPSTYNLSLTTIEE